MTAPRWRLPASPLRTSVLATASAGLAIALAIAVMATSPLQLSPLFAVKTAAVFALTMLVASGYLGAHHPFPRFGPANTTTTVRVALVALLVASLGEPGSRALAWSAAAVTLVATALDGVDGWLARRSSTSSAFGARFDMEIDALLITALALLAWRWDKAGAWVLACGLMRYTFVVAGWVWPWLERPLPPSLRRKAICVVQIVGLAIIVVPVVQAPLSAWLAAATLVALSYSFLVDVLWLLTCSARASRRAR
jgi:phosphatidylglycerophosphate synthase